MIVVEGGIQVNVHAMIVRLNDKYELAEPRNSQRAQLGLAETSPKKGSTIKDSNSFFWSSLQLILKAMQIGNCLEETKDRFS